jgi:hypothetical protein
VILYGHSVSALQWLGVALVFMGLGMDISSNYTAKTKKPPVAASSDKSQQQADV